MAGYMLVNAQFYRSGVASDILKNMNKWYGNINLGCNMLPMIQQAYKKGVGRSLFESYKINALTITRKIWPPKEHFTFEGQIIVHTREQSLLPLQKYDLKIHGFERSEYLRKHIEGPGTETHIAMNDCFHIGYGCLKQLDRNTYRLGPLFADSLEVAEALYHSITRNLPKNANLQVALPEQSNLYKTVYQDAMILQNFKCTRAYNNEVHPLELTKVFDECYV